MNDKEKQEWQITKSRASLQANMLELSSNYGEIVEIILDRKMGEWYFNLMLNRKAFNAIYKKNNYKKSNVK